MDNVGNQWCKHEVKLLRKEDTLKTLWDFNIYASCITEAKRPGLVVVKNNTKECLMVESAVC